MHERKRFRTIDHRCLLISDIFFFFPLLSFFFPFFLLFSLFSDFFPIFPPSWHASERFAAAFCEETKIQLTTVMQRRVREIELNILWNAILHTLKFEEGLGCKYAGTFVRSLKNDGSTGFQGSDSESPREESFVFVFFKVFVWGVHKSLFTN